MMRIHGWCKMIKYVVVSPPGESRGIYKLEVDDSPEKGIEEIYEYFLSMGLKKEMVELVDDETGRHMEFNWIILPLPDLEKMWRDGKYYFSVDIN